MSEIKICYVLPGVGLNAKERLRRENALNKIASSDTCVVVDQIEDGPKSIENAIDEYRAMPHLLQFICNRQRDFDGFIIGCAGDSGLEGAREQSKKPVIGPGESSLLLGVCGGKRFSMVTISGDRARMKRRLVREAGIDESRLVSSHSLDTPVLDLYLDHHRTQAQLIKIMEEAKMRGAETMVLGCMSVAFMEPESLEAITTVTKMPMVNPIVTAVKMAEAQIAMQSFGSL